jgi:hypothetical protein
MQPLWVQCERGDCSRFEDTNSFLGRDVGVGGEVEHLLLTPKRLSEKVRGQLEEVRSDHNFDVFRDKLGREWSF